MSWSFKGDKSWTPYSAADQQAIEKAHKSKRPTFKLNDVYKLDFDRMVQVRIDDPNRWRTIRRQPPASKGNKAADDDDDEAEAEQEDEEDEAKQADDNDDEEYVDEAEEEEPRAKPAKKQQLARKAPPKQRAKQPTQPTAAHTIAALAAQAEAVGESDSKRVAELEEEKKKIIADYESEIETMQADMAAKRADYERQIAQLKATADNLLEMKYEKAKEVMVLQMELEELRREHEALIGHLSPAWQILAKRGAKAAAASPADRVEAIGGGIAVVRGEKRPRDSPASSTSSSSTTTTSKRSHQSSDDEQPPTQLVTQTLALDDSDMNLFAVHTPALSLHTAPNSFQAMLDRHLINPATLSHGLRPICCQPSMGHELLVGYTHGRIELYDSGSFKLLAAVKENTRVKGEADGEAGDIDDDWRGQSSNVYCITSYTASGGQRMVAAGRGRWLVLYEREGGAAGGSSSVTMREVRSVDTGRGGFVSSLCVMREGWLAVGVSGSGNRVNIFDVDKTDEWQPLHTLQTKSTEVRRIVQLNDGRIALALCSSLQRPTDVKESGAIELWRVEGSGCERQFLQDGPTVDPSVGLRCNVIALLNPGQGRDSQLVAAYEHCSTGDRMIRLHAITHTSSSTTVVEPLNTPHASENTYTGLAAYGTGCVFGLTYGGKLVQWQRGKDGKWAQVGKGVKVEEELEVDESGHVASLSDGRLVVTGGKGSVKLWR